MTDLDVRQTDEFREWLDRLRDERAKARIAARIRRMVLANPGDMKSLGGGLIEMRIDYGPGYRIYFTRRGPRIVLLLCGGDKGSQRRDIAKARTMMEQWKNENDTV
jgi:putative addiction module killer protein